MATSQYSTTSETTNAGRASRVLLGPCSAQLRDLLRDHVPPQKFPQIIRQKMANHKWTKPQRDLILPSTGQYSGNYSDFDISLLYTLLRNLCNIPKHKNGWGNDPDPNDMSLAANIERIRICRNRLGHALDFSLSDLEFNDIWSSISTAVIEIDKVLKSNHKHEKDVDFLRYERMDFEMANYFEETLRKQYEEDLEIKSLLSKHIKCSDEKLDDMKSLIAKEFECTKAMIHDQQRRNTSIGDTYTAQCNTNSVQPTNQFRQLLRWILSGFGILRIFNFFWNTEARQGQEIKEELQHVQEQLRPIQQESNEHRRRVDDYDRRIDDHGRHIDDYGRCIDDNGRLIDDYGRQIDDHGRQIDDHGRCIDDHGRQIDEQAKQIADIKQSIPYGKVPPRQEQRESLKKLLVQAQDVPCKTGRLLEEHVVIRYDTKLPENRIAHEVDDGIEIITKNPYYVSDEAILASNLNLSGRSGKRSISATDLLIIKDCIRTNADNLWKKHSNLTIITGDSIKSVNRKNLPKTCIVLYCLSKGFIPIKEEPFPKELSCILGKFETDVREGYFTLGPTKEYGVLDAYNNPICMGSSIGSNWRDVSGSLGLFVNLPQNEMGFITCCHVLFDCIKPYVFHYQKEATSAPRYVVQPGNTSLCGREYAERECGEIVKAKFDPCSSQISVDVALVKISKRKPTTGHFVIKDHTQSKELGFTKDELPVFDTGELRRNIRPRDHDKLLLKSGTSTGLTRSLFRMDGPQVRIFQEGAWLGSKDQRDVIMKGQIEVEGGIINKTFFEPGDSGSAVFIKEPDGQLACIGIAIGKTSYGTTVVTPIGSVLDALGLNDSDVTKFS